MHNAIHQAATLVAILDPDEKSAQWTKWLNLLRGPGFLIAATLIVLYTLSKTRAIGAIIGVVLLLGLAGVAINDPRVLSGFWTNVIF